MRLRVTSPCIFAALTLAGYAFGQVDTTPPTLVAFDFSPKTVDVSSGAQDVTLTAQIKDDLAGLWYGYTVFESPSGSQYQFGYFYRTSGNELDGSYQSTVSIPQYAETGQWKIRGIFLFDLATNHSEIQADTLASSGFPVTLQITSTPDTTPPEITSLSISPSSVDVSAGPQTINFLVGLRDMPAGVSYILVYVVSPSFGQYHYWASSAPQSGTPQDGVWPVSITLPRYAETGLWQVDRVILADTVHNEIVIFPADLAAKGFPTSFTVNSNPTDTAPPRLTSLSFGPNFINTSSAPQLITVTFSAQDLLSGVDASPSAEYSLTQIGFVSPSGGQFQYVNPYYPTYDGVKRIAGTATNGTWQAQFTMPRYSEAGTWQVQYVQVQDATRNYTYLDTPALQALGLSTDLVIVQPSLQVDGMVDTPALGGAVPDTAFGERAEVIFPAGVLSTSTSVSIDVFSSDLHLPIPSGFSGTGTQFVNIGLDPHPATPLPAPGMTLVLPIQNQSTPGALLTLFRVDPVTGLLTPAVSVSGGAVTGLVNTDGLSALFTGIASLSTVVGLVPSPGVAGDVNGDGLVNCSDLAIVRASFGKRTGQSGFDSRADVNHDGIVNLLDLAFVSKKLPAGTVCT